MLGLPDKSVHLEFTQFVDGSPCPPPSLDNLLVLYVTEPKGGRIRRFAETPLLASTRAKPRTPWLALYSSIVSESYATVPSRASSTGRLV